MSKCLVKRWLPAVTCAAWMASAGIAHAQLQLIGTYYRADRDFPEYYRFWHEDANDEQEQADPANAARKDIAVLKLDLAA
ncbi:MAG TPA: hypothetical protein PLS23_17110, partial [Phycisphaerae bacterium]|nr:hypothetical protein [Phycisphaerae bacterium]